MADLTEQQLHLMKQIPDLIGVSVYDKDFAPVMSGDVWAFLERFPAGMVEMHQRCAPIMGNVLGVGFVRLTDAGRAAIAKLEG